ncbi:MAG: PhoH family protein [Hyphomonadaceae bacterium]
MSNQIDPTQHLVVAEIDAPVSIAERLLRPSDGVFRVLQVTVQPYRLAAAIGPGGLRVTGHELAVTLAQQVVEQLLTPASNGASDHDLIHIAERVIDNALRHDLAMRLIGLHHPLRPLSFGQIAFMNDLLHGDHALVFGIGPTGTGKTHIAIAAALSLLATSKVKNIVITRPYVLMEGEVWTPALREETRYDEHLMPIEDELHELVGPDETKRLKQSGHLLVTPLGRMRGRTFNDACIVLDEAQNMTESKLRMGVTRLGGNSRAIITGDPTQIALRGEEPSGLAHLLQMVQSADFAAVHHFAPRQIIRNPIVAQLEALYAQEREGGLHNAA